MATTTSTRTPWQAQIIDELGNATLNEQVAADHTHAALWVSDDEEHAELLGTAAGELAAIVIAEDKAHALEGGEGRVVKLDDLTKWSAANAAGAPEPELDGPTIEPRRQNIEEGEPAEVIEHPEEEGEPQPDDVDDDGTPLSEPAPGEQVAAFNKSDYDREDLQIPKVDGQTIDRISLKFSGEVFLDRSEPSDVAVYNAFRLGKDVALLIEAKCSSTAAKGATDRDGDLDVVVGTKGLKIHSISKPAGADWVEEA